MPEKSEAYRETVKELLEEAKKSRRDYMKIALLQKRLRELTKNGKDH